MQPSTRDGECRTYLRAASAQETAANAPLHSQYSVNDCDKECSNGSEHGVMESVACCTFYLSVSFPACRNRLVMHHDVIMPQTFAEAGLMCLSSTIMTTL